MKLFRPAALVATLVAVAAGKPCVVFDCTWGLYVFGPQQNFAIGPQSGWAATPVTANPTTPNGRPPFDGENTQCFLSQFYNALYVLDGDASNAGAVHVFNFDSQQWSTLNTNLNGVDLQKAPAILDRDTNVFFALSKSQLYQLDMGTMRDADSNTHDWQYVGDAPFAQNGAYPSPVMALAQNHIHFLNTGVPGQADIFVIHFAYFQPEIQQYDAAETDGSSFPSTHGSTSSFFKGEDEVQQKFAFIPDDGRATYIVDVTTNQTQTISGPSDKSAGSVYAASQQQLVQLTPAGDIYWLPFSPDDNGPNYSAKWSKLQLPSSATAAPSTTTGSRTVDTNHPTSSSSSSQNSASPRLSLSLFGTGLTLLFCVSFAWTLF